METARERVLGRLFCPNCKKDYNKYYKSIEISGDDSLYELASRYSVPDLMTEEEFITEVMFINNMESDKLSYGKSFIIIPYYS